MFLTENQTETFAGIVFIYTIANVISITAFAMASYILTERQKQVARSGIETGKIVCNKPSVAGSVSQRACVFCGSRVVLYPIADALHLIHGPIGCAAYTWDIRGAMSSGPELHRMSFSTDLSEKEVVFGGEPKLKVGLIELIDKYQPKAAFVYSTCIVGIIGDDVEKICRQIAEEKQIPVIPVQAPGFQGSKKDGYKVACEALFQLTGTLNLTTLLKMMAGLIKPDFGSIKVGSRVWFNSDSKINLPPQKRNIGYVFQDYALFPNMNVVNNIAYGQRKKDKTYVMELLHNFGLAEVAKRSPDKLSGGQKQRVALARALASKPKLLLLDEPLRALDNDTRTSLQNEIRKAHHYNKATTLLVSHDLTEVFRLAKKVLLIKQGTITGVGSPDEIFLNKQISGKVQITGTLVKILQQDSFYLLTIVTAMNQIIKVTAYPNDIKNLTEGERVMVFTKAFSPMICKI